jgi:hypothetical protein
MRLRLSERAVLAAIVKLSMEGGGRTDAKFETIAHRAGVSYPSVVRAVRNLVAAKRLTSERPSPRRRVLAPVPEGEKTAFAYQPDKQTQTARLVRGSLQSLPVPK